MTGMTLEARMGVDVEIDVCAGCQAFWFDKYESLKLSPASTLKLMKFIGEHPSTVKELASKDLRCPRCAIPLKATNDLQGSTRFSYWRCTGEHGRFTRFFEFLKEKSFIRALSAQQIQELRQNIQTLNCSNCGGPIDLMTSSACLHCGSPISMLDMKQPQELLRQLSKAKPETTDSELAFRLAAAKLEVETSIGQNTGPTWWRYASTDGLVQAGLSAVARWLNKAGH